MLVWIDDKKELIQLANLYIHIFSLSLPSCSYVSLLSSLALSCRKMSAVDFLAQEKIWFDKPRYDEAERRFYEGMNGSPQTTQVTALSRFNAVLMSHLFMGTTDVTSTRPPPYLCPI